MSYSKLLELDEQAATLPVDEQRWLAERIHLRLSGEPSKRPPRSLRGLCANGTPADGDVEATIRQIRDEWKKELEEFFGE